MSEKITMKSNKDIIFNALQDALKEVAELKANRPTAVAHQEAIAKETVAKVNEIVKSDPSDDLKSISTTVSELFNDLMSKYAVKTAEYTDVCNALDIKKKELKDVYKITVEADTLEALILANANKKTSLEEEIKDLEEMKNALEKNYYDALRAFKDKLNAAEEEYENEVKKKREREQEEYEYNLAREHQKDEDEWEDKKSSWSKELDEREDDVTAREDAVEENAEEFARLKSVEASIPQLIKEAEDKAEKRGKAIAENKAKTDADLEKVKTDSALELEKAKSANLQARLDEMTAKYEEVNGRLTTAYDKIESIAKATVDNKNLTDVMDTLKKAVSDKSNQK